MRPAEVPLWDGCPPHLFWFDAQHRMDRYTDLSLHFSLPTAGHPELDCPFLILDQLFYGKLCNLRLHTFISDLQVNKVVT